MRLGKKTMALLSFTIGACLFVTTALADITLGTPYDRLKDAVKQTAAKMEDGLDNYTLETSMGLYIDDQLISESTDIAMVDLVNRASVETNLTKNLGDKQYEHFTFRDEQIYAWRDGDSKFYVTEYPEGNPYWRAFSNPFAEEEAADFERIVDALVGNLKDYIIVESAADGGQVYRGTLTELQVPALVNAVLSFLVKQTMTDSGGPDAREIPRLVDDIYVKRISGRSEQEDSQLLRKFEGEVVISGADKDGLRHELKIRMDLQLKDVGSTVVEKPDLSNAEVEKVGDMQRFQRKHIGTYRNNIVIETGDELVKIGERTLEITDVQQDKVIGRYYETVDPAYADVYSKELLNFEFETEKRDWLTLFEFTTADGETYYGEIDTFEPGKVHLNMYVQWDEDGYIYIHHDDPIYFDPDFIRVFE